MGTRKVYLPGWMRWFVIPLILVMWGILTYQTFAAPGGRESLSLLGWLGLTLLLAGIGVVVWFMTNGTLPAYVIKSENGEG